MSLGFSCACVAAQGSNGGASARPARDGGGLGKLEWRTDAEPWRLRRGGSRGDDDGRKKMKRAVNHGLWRSIYMGRTESTRCGSLHRAEITATALCQ
jgi:hypothetical protein